MALTAVPSRGNGLPKLLGVFPCLTPIVISVGTSPNTLYVAETSAQLMNLSDDGTIDGLPVVSASGLFTLWAIGEVWVAGSQAAGVTFKPFIYIPGNLSSGGISVTGAGGYGTSPSQPPAKGGLYI